MKKSIIFILLLTSIFTLGKFILDNKVENNIKKNNISTKENSSSKEDDNNLLNIDNKKDNNSNKSLSKTHTNQKNKTDKIIVSTASNEYIVDVDPTIKEVVINENLSDSDKYIKVDYEEIIPIIKDIKDPKNLSISQYINLYSKVSPHIDTNMSYSELLSIASNININDLKSSYSNLTEAKKND